MVGRVYRLENGNSSSLARFQCDGRVQKHSAMRDATPELLVAEKDAAEIASVRPI